MGASGGQPHSHHAETVTAWSPCSKDCMVGGERPSHGGRAVTVLYLHIPFDRGYLCKYVLKTCYISQKLRWHIEYCLGDLRVQYLDR